MPEASPRTVHCGALATSCSQVVWLLENLPPTHRSKFFASLPSLTGTVLAYHVTQLCPTLTHSSSFIPALPAVWTELPRASKWLRDPWRYPRHAVHEVDRMFAIVLIHRLSLSLVDTCTDGGDTMVRNPTGTSAGSPRYQAPHGLTLMGNKRLVSFKKVLDEGIKWFIFFKAWPLSLSFWPSKMGQIHKAPLLLLQSGVSPGKALCLRCSCKVNLSLLFLEQASR